MARRSSTARRAATHQADAHRLKAIGSGKKGTGSGKSRDRRLVNDAAAYEAPMRTPTRLTTRTADTILGYLTENHPDRTACALAGVSTATFYRWLARGEAARDVIDQGGTVSPEENAYCAFREAVFDAKAQAAASAIDVVRKAMQGGYVTSEEPIVDLQGQPATDPTTGKVLYKRTYARYDGRLALAYLQRARPEDWSPKAAEVNATIAVDGSGGGVGAEQTMDEISSLAARLVKVREQHAADAAVRAEQQAAADDGDGDVVTAELVE